MERLNGEVKRRTHVVGILPNPAAIVRPVGALPPERNDGRAGGGAPRHDAGNDPSRRRYTDPVSPPAVVG